MSITSAIPSSGNASSRLFSISSANSIHTNPRISSGSTNANTSSLSIVVSSRPAVSSVTSSQTKRTLQRSTNSSATVSANGVPSWPSSDGRKKAKPVAVISAPLRLSGRRCQAIEAAGRERAADAGEHHLETLYRLVAVEQRRAAATSSSATTAAVHSAAQNAT